MFELSNELQNSLYVCDKKVMNRRSFLGNSALVGGLGSMLSGGIGYQAIQEALFLKKGIFAKNIIFLVSDGMSSGTLNMADRLISVRDGKSSNWIQLYKENKIVRALMDTASANSFVTDSAAAGSAWGGGVRVPNGSINVNADGSTNVPILQKFKAAGKAVGCVTSVPITHATPASFCVNVKSRASQAEIADQYLKLKFDVMMGGGGKYFSKDLRKDQRDLYTEFNQAGIQVAKTKADLKKLNPSGPILGVFAEDALPYAIDRIADPQLNELIPSLAELTALAIDRLQNHPNGFVMQVEAGKVDWAAHANDTAAILHDQIEFDQAVGVAIAFAEARKDTLVIITTDHGNANPGLFKHKNADQMFATILNQRQSNDWVLMGIKPSDSVSQTIERIESAQKIVLSNDQAETILGYYKNLDEDGTYNEYKLPFKKYGEMQSHFTSVSWAGTDHSSDFVELAMFGPGSELLNPHVLNTDLHQIMLKATGI